MHFHFPREKFQFVNYNTNTPTHTYTRTSTTLRPTYYTFERPWIVNDRLTVILMLICVDKTKGF